MENPILSITDLCKAYSTKVALNNVSFTINKGDIYGLIGQNGAGKTTLIRVLNQIIDLDSGTILFLNKALTRVDVAQIGYLPEERGLYKNMTIEKQAIYFAQLKGMHLSEAKNQLDFWLKRFDILDWKNKKIQDLSKGMAQKVQFIITVLHQPKLLILDEPFSGFDPINAELIAKEIKNLAKQGTTVIFSSHRMESVAEMCDALCLLHKGNVLLEGSIDVLQKKYAKEVFEIQLTHGDKDQLNSFVSNKNYKTVIVNDDMNHLILEVTKLHVEVNLLNDVLKIGELKVYKQHVPSLQEIFIKTIKNA